MELFICNHLEELRGVGLPPLSVGKGKAIIPISFRFYFYISYTASGMALASFSSKIIDTCFIYSISCVWLHGVTSIKSPLNYMAHEKWSMLSFSFALNFWRSRMFTEIYPCLNMLQYTNQCDWTIGLMMKRVILSKVKLDTQGRLYRLGYIAW